MTRTRTLVLAVLVAAISAATAGSLFSSATKSAATGPCFVTGSGGYRITTGPSSNYTVRIDNSAAHPTLRMQLVDKPAGADFVLMDDSEAGSGCAGAATIKSIRVDNRAAAPDMTVALSRDPADIRIYVRSALYSEQDAAALIAVMWRTAHKGAAFRRVAGR